MGNYRFKLSDIVPNSWFCKLKDMATTRKQDSQVAATSEPLRPKQPHHSVPRKSYYYTRELVPKEPKDETNSSPTNPKPSGTKIFPDPPRKSSKQRTKKRSLRSPKLVSSSVPASCRCRPTKPDSPPDFSVSLSDSSNDPECCCLFPPEFRCDHALTNDSASDCNVDSALDGVVVDADKKSKERNFSEKLDLFEKISDLDLPPIVTKPVNFEEKKKDSKNTKETVKCRRNSPAKWELHERADGSFSVKIVKEERTTPKESKHIGSFRRPYSGNSPGVRLRVNSPKVGSRRIQGRKSLSSMSSGYRRGTSDSLAIVKSSLDPQKDFRESMVEMILENNIKASKDLEDLLACYLSLNSDEYHDLIIKVFKQIWFDLS